MTNEKDYSYGSLRLKRNTLDLLKDVKEAFEASYGQRFTMDEFIRHMILTIENGDSGVWDIYQTKKAQKDELQAIIEASQKQREGKKQHASI